MRRAARLLRAFAMFWVDFIAGDDWRVAAGIALALISTAVLAHHGRAVWWLMPVAALSLLSLSLWRAVAALDRTEGRSGD